MVRKLTIGLFGFLLTSTFNAFASFPHFNRVECACVPNYCGGPKFGLEALYLKPSNSYLDYALKYNNNITGLTTGVVLSDGLYHSIKPDYEFGFRANIGYQLPCLGEDINLAYTHLRDSDKNIVFSATDFALFSSFFSGGSNNIGVSDVTIIFPGELPLILSVTVPVPIANATMTQHFDYSAWDLEFGQDIKLGCSSNLHWFGGLRYSKVEDHLTARYEGANSVPIATGVVGTTGLATVSSTFNLRQTSDFQGVGPRFGTHLAYQLGGFALVGELASSLLVGDVESAYSDLLHQVVVGELIPVTTTPIISFSIPTTINSTFSFKHDSDPRVVPNLEGKLGVEYGYSFRNCSQSLIKLEAGWMTSHYFNTFDRLSAVGANLPEFRTRQTSDISFAGPYIGINVKM